MSVLALLLTSPFIECQHPLPLFSHIIHTIITASNSSKVSCPSSSSSSDEVSSVIRGRKLLNKELKTLFAHLSTVLTPSIIIVVVEVVGVELEEEEG